MSNNAYITLMSTDNYIYFVVALWDSLMKTKPKYPFYVVVTQNIKQETIDILNKLNINWIRVDGSIWQEAAKNTDNIQHYKDAFSKLTIFSLTQFDKCVYLDSDMLILQNIDELFDKPDFTSVEDCAPFRSHSINYTLGSSAFCGGLFVFTPSLVFYNKLVTDLPNVMNKKILVNGVEKQVDWHDQALLYYYNQDWMSRKELQLSPAYQLLVSQRILDAYKKVNKNLNNVKVFHFIRYKNTLLNNDNIKISSSDMEEYTIYRDYFNRINNNIIKYDLNIPLLNVNKFIYSSSIKKDNRSWNRPTFTYQRTLADDPTNMMEF